MVNLSLVIILFTLVCAVILVVIALNQRTKPFKAAKINAERKAQRAEKKAIQASVKSKKAAAKAANPEAEEARKALSALFDRRDIEEEERKADQERKALAEAIAKALRKGKN